MLLSPSCLCCLPGRPLFPCLLVSACLLPPAPSLCLVLSARLVVRCPGWCLWLPLLRGFGLFCWRGLFFVWLGLFGVSLCWLSLAGFSFLRLAFVGFASRCEFLFEKLFLICTRNSFLQKRFVVLFLNSCKQTNSFLLRVICFWKSSDYSFHLKHFLSRVWREGLPSGFFPSFNGGLRCSVVPWMWLTALSMLSLDMTGQQQ